MWASCLPLVGWEVSATTSMRGVRRPDMSAWFTAAPHLAPGSTDSMEKPWCTHRHAGSNPAGARSTERWGLVSPAIRATDRLTRWCPSKLALDREKCEGHVRGSLPRPIACEILTDTSQSQRVKPGEARRGRKADAVTARRDERGGLPWQRNRALDDGSLNHGAPHLHCTSTEHASSTSRKQEA